MDHDHRDREGAKKLYGLIKGVKVAMMSTVDPDGTLHSRPMWSYEADDHGDLWFFTHARATVTNELRDNAEVNLAFSDPSHQTFVSVWGRASVVNDSAKVHRIWSEWLRAWFPKGPDDPTIRLVRVHPTGGEYWDSPSQTIIALYGYAKARLTGETPLELTDHKKVALDA